MTYPATWLELEARVNERTMFGQPGVRDPEAPCEVFDPVEDIDWLGLRVAAPGDGDCDSDGHYLCYGCAHLSARRRAELTDSEVTS